MSIDFNKAASAAVVLPPAKPKPHELQREVVRMFTQFYTDAVERMTLRFASASTHALEIQLRTSATRFRADEKTVLKHWLKHFAEFNQETHINTDGQFSRSDAGFLALCKARIIHSNMQVRPSRKVLVPIWQCHLLQTIFSCTHTMDSRFAWPDREVMDSFLLFVAKTIDMHFNVPKEGIQKLCRLVERTDFNVSAGLAADDTGDMMTSGKMQLQAYQKLHVPADLQRRLDEQAEKRKFKSSNKKAAALAEDDKEESEEVMGYVWRTASQELVHNFVPKMARFTWKVLSDRFLLHKYRPKGANPPQPLVFDKASHRRVQAFMDKTLGTGEKNWSGQVDLIGQDVKTSAEFRRFACLFCLPIGWEVHFTRSGQIDSGNIGYSDILADMLGAKLSGFIQEMMMKPMGILAQKRDIIYYEPILLALIDALTVRMQKFKWSETYLITEPHSVAAREFFSAPTYLGKKPAPRVVAPMEKQWSVFYRHEFIQCGSFLTAFQVYLALCKRDLSTVEGDKDDLCIYLEGGENIAGVWEIFRPVPSAEEEVAIESGDEDEPGRSDTPDGEVEDVTGMDEEESKSQSS